MNNYPQPAVQPSLTVVCRAGLCNRLRVLLSGLALAEATGRRFKQLWPLTPYCAAPFEALFESAWPVETVSETSITNLSCLSYQPYKLPDLLTAAPSELTICTSHWLVQPRRFPAHQPLELRCQELVAELTPVPELQRAIDSFRQEHFRPTMIGVHLRRGDFISYRPDVAGNTPEAMAAVDSLLDQSPAAGVLLCTDDTTDLRAVFTARYGERVCYTVPRTVDRSTPAAIQDAVIDLWLLRATDYFVGTEGSSFSGMAVFNRPAPVIWCKGDLPDYHHFEQSMRRTGLYQLIKAVGRYHFMREIPFPVLWRYYIHGPRRRACKILKRLSPDLHQKYCA